LAFALRSGRFVTRVFLAFAVVAVPPVLLLAFVTAARLSQTFEESSARRAARGLQAAAHRVDRLRLRAAERAEAMAREGLDALVDDPAAVEALGARHELPVLTVLDAEGRVVASRHWPAGFGLEDRSTAIGTDRPYRRELVASGHGGTERLAVVATRRAQAAGQPVILRAGYLLDEDLAAELSTLLGTEVGLLDTARGTWIAAPRSPLRAWKAPEAADAARGAVKLGDAAYMWAADELAPGLRLVVLDSRGDEQELLGRLRQVTVGVAGAALLLALLAGAWISRRVTRPVASLAEGARRVAAGDLQAAVPVEGGRELEELAASFNHMTAELLSSRERLLQAERVAAWREMARRLAHELKNPLFPIQLSIETLRRAQERGEKRFPELFLESSSTIIEEIGSLRRIIDEFSQFARMPRPRLVPTEVNAVVGQVLALYEARAEGMSVTRELAAALPVVPADPDLLARALGNLVANALEAMAAGGTLTVRTSQAAGGGVSVEIADTGPGLDDDQRTRLFTPYFTTKRGGTGLGLAIVQGVIADHGGRVDVRSAPGAGTTFTITLSAVAAAPPATLAQDHAEPAPSVRESAP
jgi:two-component system nitrogen regulation sensor histidine kinase NtrY